jgi:hypothetical protein
MCGKMKTKREKPMTKVAGFTDRDFLNKIVKLGKALCKAVQLATPILKKKYPNNELIENLILAIGVVCALLPDVENEFLPVYGDNTEPLEDPNEIPGINPSLPPATGGDIS